MKAILASICLSLASLLVGAQNKPAPPKTSAWFPRYDFNPGLFQKPAPSFGPMARWWWPGNYVTKDELKREINLFADHGFAGVEVQPLAISLPPLPEAEKAKVTSWDTPDYYANLRTVLEEARRRNLIVDVTNGSGWPPSAPILQPEDGFLSLEFSDTTVTGGNALSFPLPQLVSSKNRTRSVPQLQAVIIAKTGPKTTGGEGTIALESASTKVITSSSRNGILTYSFPEGAWRVIAFWAVPSGEQPSLAATPKSGPVVDHLNTQKVLKLYNHLFGERTGLAPYFGNPMRAVFSDSYEFKANRHYSLDLLEWFKTKRGYDLTPYLPANMQKGYNYVAFMRPNAKPDFSFSDQDWRLRYDYDITVGELVGEHFFNTSRTWAEQRGLLFRTQGYGLHMDMIAMAGLASIPETESMLGPEADLKIMTSGALLYNRPIVTAESAVFNGRAYTTTPQKIKLAVDKLFAVGVNQIIYHGVPYRYKPETLGPEGWYPFASPFLGSINFSANLGEGNVFWKDQKAINEYVSRIQYALRSGKPRADVLLYFPFLDVEGMPDNPEEILTKGHLKEVDGPLPKTKDDTSPAKAAWAKGVYPLINQLEAGGISWAWVNDASLQEASLTKEGRISIRGNTFQALIVANDSIIGLKTAEKINDLAKKGMRMLASGVLPTKQPSFLNWQENDKKTAQSFAVALKAKNSRFIQHEGELASWINGLAQPVRFQSQFSFTRKAEREMVDGSRLEFIWNKSNEWQTISMILATNYVGSYWLNPETGAIIPNTNSTITYRLAPYGSVILYATTKKTVPAAVLAAPPLLAAGAREVSQLDDWDIQTDSVSIKSSSLFDWRTRDAFQFLSGDGVYKTSFTLENKKSTTHYFLDLGKVYFTAEVKVNGEAAGKRIYAPYQLDITPYLQAGTNQIEVRVTPTQLNGFIGKAKQGDKRYSEFKNKTDQLMAAGLVGPVRILEK
ncbi:glycosyl hydrolase [Spirosoma endophyticum]|uniref:Glycosyl hydrolases family 2, sugar binding domain n=1 Tax=Spirosoma endophyticum TaxID=662367 RepID=A0A1I2GTS6_9BACT|nr:glycosyl hydrolase [Spirosoma endophyticum]SFF20638.1 Glycosyl hydrolases family 2, sugar binding domain [Spirosoma endophyticum]